MCEAFGDVTRGRMQRISVKVLLLLVSVILLAQPRFTQFMTGLGMIVLCAWLQRQRLLRKQLALVGGAVGGGGYGNWGHFFYFLPLGLLIFGGIFAVVGAMHIFDVRGGEMEWFAPTNARVALSNSSLATTPSPEPSSNRYVASPGRGPNQADLTDATATSVLQRIDLPAMFRKGEQGIVPHTTYTAPDGATLTFDAGKTSEFALNRMWELEQALPGRSVTYKAREAASFTISGYVDGRIFYTRTAWNSANWNSYTLTYADEVKTAYDPTVTTLNRSLRENMPGRR